MMKRHANDAMRTTIWCLGLVGMLAVVGPAHSQDITTGLIAHYLLNETTGATTAVDSSGSGNDAALNGTPVWVTGKIGGGIQFDSAGDYVHDATAVNLPGDATAPFTLATWIKAAAYTNLSHLFGFGFFPPDQVAPNIHRGIIAFNNNYYFWGSGADWDSGIAFDTDSVWHHIAFTASSTTITFYRDGTQRAQGTRPAALATLAQNRITLGSHHQAGTDFLGFLDDVRIYARALTGDDIAALYALGTASVARPRRGIVVLE